MDSFKISSCIKEISFFTSPDTLKRAQTINNLKHTVFVMFINKIP